MPVNLMKHWEELCAYAALNCPYEVVRDDDEGVYKISIPSMNLAVVWHPCNPAYLSGKTGDYFSGLSEKAEGIGIHLVQIWEDQYLAKREIVESRIGSLFGISIRVHARKTAADRIVRVLADEFLRRNHLLGSCSAARHYGLTLNSELIAVASFGKARKIRRGNQYYRSFELIRFCSRNGYTVVGGMSKLLYRFIGDRAPDDISTYADRDWSDGSAYAKLGFRREGVISARKFSLITDRWERTPISLKQSEPTALKDNQKLLVYNSGSIKFLLDLIHPKPG